MDVTIIIDTEVGEDITTVWKETIVNIVAEEIKEKDLLVTLHLLVALRLHLPERLKVDLNLDVAENLIVMVIVIISSIEEISLVVHLIPTSSFKTSPTVLIILDRNVDATHTSFTLIKVTFGCKR